MIIIQKKRIQIIILCLIISIISFAFQIAKDENIKLENKKTEETEETTATPVSGKTIIVDAGHGTPDEGAESSNRNNRSANKLTNSIKITKSFRNKWEHSNINTFR